MRASPNEEGFVWRYDDHITLVGNYTCVGVSFLSGLPLEISPEYLDYHQCQCLTGFFGLPPNNCTLCPLNAHCWFGGRTLTWPIGYYPIILGNFFLTF